jgi:hypothetical protein
MAACCGNGAALLAPDWRSRNERLWLVLLQICVSATLAARGWLTWKGDSPIRGLVWQEDWWSGLLEKQFSIPWEEFAKKSDPAITSGLALIGCLLIALAIVPWLTGRFPKSRGLLWLAAFLLLLDSVARWVGVDYDFGMAIEHSLQMFAPVALYFALSFPKRIRAVAIGIAIATAFTFTGHGFYAAGIHPVPLSYQTMTMKLLGTGGEATLHFLLIAGWLDIIAAIALFIAPLRRAALLYCIGWGLLTALARVVSHFSFSASGWALDPWLAETLVRSSHWMMPLLLLGLLRRRSRLP